MIEGIKIVLNKKKGKELLSEIYNKKSAFLCVLGNTETAKIPGISAAGAFPEITDLTPAGDLEFLLLERCVCLDGVPVTPEGIPTPAIITLACKNLAKFPVFGVSAGLRVNPAVPFIVAGSIPGNDIRTGNAVEDPLKIYENGKMIGEQIARAVDFLCIGESIPGGTTTALGVLLAMGIDAREKVSSSMPNNPSELKIKVVEEGLRNAGIKEGDCKEDPFSAIKAVGDPMQAAFSGIVDGAHKYVPVILAGGTQMGAILSILSKTNPNSLENVILGTTRWILEDKTSDIEFLVKKIANQVPLIGVDLDFSETRYDGLKAYERGVVKEGVGAGGAALTTLVMNPELGIQDIVNEVEKIYSKII
ncbi:MAG: nicotinate mononucleotide-dependent phosphoribosyltransferase CobT [Candidatus Hydrothermarchaeota archaeon]